MRIHFSILSLLVALFMSRLAWASPGAMEAFFILFVLAGLIFNLIFSFIFFGRIVIARIRLKERSSLREKTLILLVMSGLGMIGFVGAMIFMKLTNSYIFPTAKLGPGNAVALTFFFHALSCWFIRLALKRAL